MPKIQEYMESFTIAMPTRMRLQHSLSRLCVLLLSMRILPLFVLVMLSKIFQRLSPIIKEKAPDIQEKLPAIDGS